MIEIFAFKEPRIALARLLAKARSRVNMPNSRVLSMRGEGMTKVTRTSKSFPRAAFECIAISFPRLRDLFILSNPFRVRSTGYRLVRRSFGEA